MRRSNSDPAEPLLPIHLPQLNVARETDENGSSSSQPKFSHTDVDSQLHGSCFPDPSTQQDTVDSDEEPYNMKELILEKPEDVIQYLEEEGLIHLGDFEAPDVSVLAAFGSTSEILTMGCDQLEVGWESMWKQKLAEATEKKTRLSDHIRRISRAGWSQSYTLQAFVVNMADAAAEGHKGILRPLLLRYKAHACPKTVFALPAVQAVIHFKWNHGARRYLFFELTAYAVWLLAFTVFTVSMVHEDTGVQSYHTLWETTTGWVSIIASSASVTAMSYFLYTDFCTFLSYKRAWLSVTNVADLVSYVLQVVIFNLHISRILIGSNLFSILVATQHVVMWSKLHYYARVFSPTKNLFLDTVRIVLDDAKWFILFMLLTMMGFGFAFYALYRQDDFIDFNSVWHSQASMFAYMLAMFDYSVFYNSKNPVAAMVLFMVYNVIVTVLLVNVLIALMTNALQKVSQDEGLRFLLYRAQVIDEIESTIPAWIRWGGGKCAPPSYVHLLRVSPESTYEPNLYSIWSGMGSLQTHLMTAQDEAKGKLIQLEQQVANMNRKMDLLTRLLLSSSNGTTSSSPEGYYQEALDRAASARQWGWAGAAGISAGRRSKFKPATKQGYRTTDDLDDLLEVLPASWLNDRAPVIQRAPFTAGQRSGSRSPKRKSTMQPQGSFSRQFQVQRSGSQFSSFTTASAFPRMSSTKSDS